MFCSCPSSETQGQSVGSGEKARRKFSSTCGKAPGYRLSTDHFQTVKRMLAPDWAQKMLCIIVPSRRTASPEFCSWVRRRDLITACLAHASKKCTQSGNFQFDINSPFQNTVYPKTEEAFPKIQAWAYNRYLRLHRLHIRCHDSRQPRKRRMKSEFTFFQSLSWLFQLARSPSTLLELNFYQLDPSS